MIADELELSELIATTLDLIAEQGMEVTLVRVEMERTDSGGVRRQNPDALDAKRRFFGAVTTDPRIIVNDQGDHVEARHVLVGPPGDDIVEKDTFQVGTRTFKVMEIHPDGSYQTKAWVIESG